VVVAIINCKQGIDTYPIASGLDEGEHEFAIWKRTETFQERLDFIGLGLEGDILNLPPRPLLNIEVFGDSISAGLALDAIGDDQSPPFSNAYLTYGAVIAREMEAAYHGIAISGIGLKNSWGPTNMVDDHWFRVDPNDPASLWDFTLFRPDIVIVNLGQNDYWTANPGPSIIDEYVAFGNQIRSTYGEDTSIIFALGTMCAVESAMADYVVTAANMMQESGDERVFSILFPFPGHYDHPHAMENRYMADMLLELIANNKLACRGGNLDECVTACTDPADEERCFDYCNLQC